MSDMAERQIRTKFVYGLTIFKWPQTDRNAHIIPITPHLPLVHEFLRQATVVPVKEALELLALGHVALCAPENAKGLVAQQRHLVDAEHLHRLGRHRAPQIANADAKAAADAGRSARDGRGEGDGRGRGHRDDRQRRGR
jgi:hypothetical protein